MLQSALQFQIARILLRFQIASIATLRFGHLGSYGFVLSGEDLGCILSSVLGLTCTGVLYLVWGTGDRKPTAVSAQAWACQFPFPHIVLVLLEGQCALCVSS